VRDGEAENETDAKDTLLLIHNCTSADVEYLARLRAEGQVPEREFFIDNLLVRVHFIIVMIRWTGLAPWEFEFPFPGSLTSTFLAEGKVPNPNPKSQILNPEFQKSNSEPEPQKSNSELCSLHQNPTPRTLNACPRWTPPPPPICSQSVVVHSRARITIHIGPTLGALLP